MDKESTPAADPGPHARSLYRASINASLDQDAVRKLVEEELGRQNKWVEFAQKQVDDIRRFFTLLFTVTSAATVLVAGYGLWSLADFKADARASLDDRVKEATAEMRRTLEERVNREFSDVHTRVQARLNAELDRPAIQKTIDEAVQSIVKNRVSAIVRTSLEPAEQKIAELQNTLRFNQLIVAAQSYDRSAFLELRRIAENASGAPDKVRQAGFTLTQITATLREKTNSLELVDMVLFGALSGRDTLTRDILARVRSEDSPKRRAAAVRSLAERLGIRDAADHAAILSTLRDVLYRDNELSVLATVFFVLENRYNTRSFRFLDIDGAIKWLDGGGPSK